MKHPMDVLYAGNVTFLESLLADPNADLAWTTWAHDTLTRSQDLPLAAVVASPAPGAVAEQSPEPAAPAFDARRNFQRFLQEKGFQYAHLNPLEDKAEANERLQVALDSAGLKPPPGETQQILLNQYCSSIGLELSGSEGPEREFWVSAMESSLGAITTASGSSPLT